MPEDIISFEDPEVEETETPEEEVKPETPSYVTMAQFDQSMGKLADLIQTLVPKAPSAQKQAEDPTWEEKIYTAAAEKATAQIMEVNRPMMLSGLIQKIAGSYSEDVQSQLEGLISHLNGAQLYNVTQNPADLKQLRLMAAGLHSEAQEKPDPKKKEEKVKAPVSSPSGSVGAATINESDLANEYWRNFSDVPGFTKDMAKRMAKDNA